MPRLLRTEPPLEVKCRVAMRQLGELWPDAVIDAHRGGLGKLLDQFLTQLKILVDEPTLNLQHWPPLGDRNKVFDRDGNHIEYDPPQHSVDHLEYIGAHEHKIRTNKRGVNGQHPDRVLIKKRRRLDRAREALASALDKTTKKKRSTLRSKKSTWPKGRKIRSRGFDRRA